MNSDYLDAEYGVIGSILIDPGPVLPIVNGTLRPEDFSLALNQSVYRAMLEMYEEGAAIDPVTVQERLKPENPEIRSYILQCMDITPTAAHVEIYVQIVRNASTLREIRATAEAVAAAAEETGDAQEALSFALDKLTAIQQERAAGDLVTSHDAMMDFYRYRTDFDKHPGSKYVHTGLENLDEKSGGMVNGGLYILAARPGMGKTTLALNIAENTAEQNAPVLYVTLEMSETQISAKRIARASGVPYAVLYGKAMGEQEYVRMAQAASALSKAPLTINRKPGATVARIESMARRIKDLRLLVVDYLQLIAPSRRSKDMREETTEISRGLKLLAVKLDVPVLCLSQLSREIERRQNKKPVMSDLRESGAIEADADGIWMLYQPGEPDEDAAPWNGMETDCIIAKNRHGETGEIRLTFFKAQSKMVPIRERKSGL